MTTTASATTLRVVLIKPSKYDDEGYVITHRRGVLPSNTLAALNGLTRDLHSRRALGDHVRLEVEMIDETVQRVAPRKIMRRARHADKTVICLVGVQTNQFPRAADLALEFRDLGATIMLGGFHVSGTLAMLGMTPEIQSIIDLGVTVVCGEVELRWDELLMATIENRLEPLYNFVDDKPSLADAPPPVMPRSYRRRFAYKHMQTMDTSRGCPFNCSFCTIINVQGRKMRARGVERAIQRVRECAAEGVHFFFFVDDNLARNQEWENLFDALIELRETEGIAISFMMQVDLLSHTIKGFVEKARKAGCTQVFLGMESLNPANLMDAGKRQNKIEEYRGLINTWRQNEIATHTGYIIGFDGDTPESVIEHDVERLMHEVQPDQASFFMMTPLPGSADHKRWTAEGRAMDKDFNRYDSFHAAMPHPNMTGEEWYNTYLAAWRKFYSFDNMKRILERAPDRNYFNIMKNFIWYKNALIEGEHPMITGFWRVKHRLDRRSSFAKEGRWAFLKRRTRENLHLGREWIKLMWEMQELWLATWPQRDRRVQIARESLVRWRDIGKSCLNPLQWHAAAAMLWTRMLIVGRKRLISTRENITISRRALNAYWKETFHRFRRLHWHRVDIGQTMINLWNEAKVDALFLVHLIRSGSIESLFAGARG